VQSNWRRDESHKLTIKDVTAIMNENLEILLVGTGASGQMRVLPEVERAAESRNIQLIVQPTGEACDTYIQLSKVKKVVAALHLTC